MNSISVLRVCARARASIVGCSFGRVAYVRALSPMSCGWNALARLPQDDKRRVRTELYLESSTCVRVIAQQACVTAAATPANVYRPICDKTAPLQIVKTGAATG
jgi:hypothetical protein